MFLINHKKSSNYLITLFSLHNEIVFSLGNVCMKFKYNYKGNTSYIVKKGVGWGIRVVSLGS